VGGEFSERESCHSVKGESREFLAQDGEYGEAMGVESRLTDRCAGEFFGRSLKGNPREGITEDLIGFAEEIGSHGVSGGQILAHADCLCALTGEEKCCFHEIMGCDG
jgi:hypothetical protein